MIEFSGPYYPISVSLFPLCLGRVVSMVIRVFTEWGDLNDSTLSNAFAPRASSSCFVVSQSPLKSWRLLVCMIFNVLWLNYDMSYTGSKWIVLFAFLPIFLADAAFPRSTVIFLWVPLHFPQAEPLDIILLFCYVRAIDKFKLVVWCSLIRCDRSWVILESNFASLVCVRFPWVVFPEGVLHMLSFVCFTTVWWLRYKVIRPSGPHRLLNSACLWQQFPFPKKSMCSAYQPILYL